MAVLIKRSGRYSPLVPQISIKSLLLIGRELINASILFRLFELSEFLSGGVHQEDLSANKRQ